MTSYTKQTALPVWGASRFGESGDFADILNPAITNTLSLLNNFAQDPQFADRWASIFGSGSRVTPNQFLEALTTLPALEVRSATELQEASGAFSSQTNTIYLNENLLSPEQSAHLVSTLIEEIGHYLDARFNPVDTAGDEGELFSALVRGVDLSTSELNRIHNENDHKEISLDGQSITVEQAADVTLPLTAVSFPKEVIPVTAGKIDFWAKLSGYSGEINNNVRAPYFFVLTDGTTNFEIGFNANNGLGIGGLTGNALGTVTGTGSWSNAWTYEQVLGTGHTDEWHHYIYQWDKNGIPGLGAGKNVAIYIDGILNSSQWYTGATSIAPFTGGTLNLITTQLQPVAHFLDEVAIDEIKIYDGNNNLILWNTLGSAQEINNSAVGLDGSFNGGGDAHFVPGISGNAVMAKLVWAVGPAPTVAVKGATFSLAENSLAGTDIGTVTAIGATPLSYAISAGNSDPNGDGKAAFAINSGTGKLSVNDQGDLDFETTPHFNLTVTATDPQGISGSGAIALNLVNVDEPGNEPPAAQDATFTVAENSANATVVGTVTAADVDLGDTLTYVITAGNSDPDGDSQSAFAINPVIGTIAVNDSGDLDFETTPQFNLLVTATDSGGLIDGSVATINLIDLLASPLIDNVAPTATYIENSSATILAPALTVSHTESSTLETATATIRSGFVTGDELSANTGVTNITASYTATNHVLLLSGTDSLANYQQVLRTVQYVSSSNNPTNFYANLTRTIDWQVNDGTLSSLFGTSSSFDAGSDQWFVAIGDLNGDGRPDITTPNRNSNNVSVLLGNGDGTFQPQQKFNTGNGPISVAIGDLNGDGRPDIVTANFSSNDVSVLLGNGDGTFQPQQSLKAGSAARSIAIGDFNGDGKPDITNANAYSNTVSVMLGKGDGTFLPQQIFSVGTEPSSIAIGDLNGDGRLDITTSNLLSNNVSVLLGNGDGSFQPQQKFAAGIYTNAVAIGDLNGDGRLDITTANFSSKNVSVLLGNGDGSFQAQQKYDTGYSLGNVVIGDINGDGRLDITNANLYSNNVSVLLGNGDGSFQPKQNFDVGHFQLSVAIGDLNGDGKLDITTANHESNNVSVLLNTATNSSATQHSTLTITAVNDAPTLANAIGDPPATEINDPFRFTFNANTFADDSILTYSSMLDDGSPLPAWLSFDATTRTFSGTPLAGDSANLSVEVMASDGVNPPAADTFILAVVEPANDAAVGADKTVIMPKNTAYVFKVTDFGFSDPNDPSPNNFFAVKVATLPLLGNLTNNGIAVTTEQFIPVADITGGQLKFTPATEATGTHYADFTFQVQDDGGIANGGIDLDPTANQMTINVTAGGSSQGDPHLFTFDGLYYDFQGKGDFVLVHALDSDLEVQVRQASWSANPLTTLNVGLATVIDGNLVTFDVNQPQPLVNGTAFEVALGETRSLGQGTLSHSSIAKYDLQGDLYTLTYANGDQLTAECFAGFLIDPTVYLINTHNVVGLLGNNNGTPDDDIAFLDGTVPVNPLSTQTLEGDFADNWRVSAEKSLFTHSYGEDSPDNIKLSSNNGSNSPTGESEGNTLADVSEPANLAENDAPKIEYATVAQIATDLTSLGINALDSITSANFANRSAGNTFSVDIFEFQGGNIDLSALAANTGNAGEQVFTSLLGGDNLPSVLASSGELYFEQSSPVEYSDNETYNAADYSISITGVSSLNCDAFV